MHPFDRIAHRCQEVNSVVCVGLDPHFELLPPQLDPGSPVQRCRQFFFEILEALQGVVGVVKPQIAFFEQLGAEGLALYFELIREAHRRSFLVVGDIKRSDIGSTAAAYARAHLGGTDGSAADAVTLNPYLGIDSIQPFLDVGRKHGRGVFVLVRTSNPSSSEFQSLSCGGTALFEHVGRRLEEWGRDNSGNQGFTDVGAVVGATHPEEAARLRKILPQTFFLVPGFGAQGGTAAGVRGAFDPAGRGAIVSSSRGILFACRQERFQTLYFAEAARRAAEEMSAQLNDAIDPNG